jgi:hypothetical protein
MTSNDLWMSLFVGSFLVSAYIILSIIVITIMKSASSSSDRYK